MTKQKKQIMLDNIFIILFIVTTQHPYGELIVTNAILVLPALKPKETIA